MPKHLTSTKNQVVRSAVKLHRRRTRRETGRILVEGDNAVHAAMRAGHLPETLFVTQRHSSEPWVAGADDVYIVTEAILQSLGTTTSPQSPIGIFRRPAPAAIEADRNVVVLVEIGDPGNVGTVIRTAAALRWQVAVTEHTVDVWNPKVLRSGAGAHFQTTVVEMTMDDIDALPHVTIATVPEGGRGDVASDQPVALLIGNEAHGLPAGLIDRSDQRLSIPMPGGTESLNAAVSAALGMWILQEEDR